MTSEQHRPLTPHQERNRAARQRNIATALERHAAELLKVDGKLREVLDLHGPHVYTCMSEYGAWCHGCDGGWYAEGPAYWPCTTWEFITDEDQSQWNPPIEDVERR